MSEQATSLNLYFLIARTVVDSKPETDLNKYKIIDNVFNNNINHHSFERKRNKHSDLDWSQF